MALVLSLDNPLLQTYIFYVAVLGLKTLLMSTLTALQRFKTGAFANPEDLKVKGDGAKVRLDEDVERVRRAHLNDLENNLVFMLVSFVYVISGPSVWLATMLFRVFTVARFVHTLVYAVVVTPQPARAIAWMVGYGITVYMAISIVLTYLTAM